MTSSQKIRHLVTEPKFGFTLLLFCLISLLLFPGFLENHMAMGMKSKWILSLILLASLYLIVHQLRELLIGIALVVPPLLGNWWGEILPLPFGVYVASGFYIIFLSYISVFIFQFIFETDQVSLNMIFAAICLYMYIGLVWMFIYLVTEVSHPGSFSFRTELPIDPEDLVHSLRNHFAYFSYVTLATLGYGDVTPLTRLARGWAVLETLTGQFYLAVVVARLVGLFITNRR